MPDFPPDFAGWADAGTGAPAAALPPDFAGWVPDAPRSTKSDEERRRQAEKIGLFDDDLLNHAQGLPTKGEDGPPQPEVVKSAQQELAARKKKFDDWEAPPTMVDSGVRGARQGATFNFGDELAAISAASPIPGKNPDVPDVSFGPDLIAGGARLLGEKIAPSIFGTGGGEAYDETKARERARNEEAQRVNPGSYLTGEFGGALATLPVTPMITPFRAAEGAGIATRAAAGAGNLAATGATYGAVAGAGGADGDLVDRAIGAGKGAALGAVVAPAVGGAVHSVGAAAGVVGDHIKASRNPTGVAQEMAAERVRASGADPQELADRVQAAHDAGSTQFTLADASPDNLGGLPGTIVRQQGPGRAPAREFLDNRQFGSEDSSSQTQRVNSAISDLFGSGRQADEISAAADARSTQAQPHFDEAYKVGSYTTPVLDELATRPSVVQALNSAEKIANDEGRTLPTIIRDQNGNPVSNEAFQNFHADQRARIDRDVADLLGSDGSLETTNRLIRERAEQASPLYDAARSQTIPDDILKPSTRPPSTTPRDTAATAADPRQRIEDAYTAATGGKYGEMVGLDKIRAALPDLDRATVDAELKKILASEGEKATLQRNDDPRRITPAQKEAAFSPAGEPFHTLAISGPKAGASELSPLAQRVLEAMPRIAGGYGTRGYISDLRKAFPNVPRAELDKALTEVHVGDNDAHLMHMDNPRDKRAAESREAAVDFKGDPKHLFWVNEPREAAAAADAARSQTAPGNQGLIDLLPRLKAAGAFESAVKKMRIDNQPFDIGNVRAWDYMKRALDDKIGAAVRAGEKDDARILTGLKRELTSTIDATVPEYGQARQVFSSHSDLVNAVEDGSKALSPSYTREQLAADFPELTSGEQEMFRIGASNALREKLANAAGTGALPNAFATDGALAQKLQMLAPSAEHFNRFANRMADEARRFTEASVPDVSTWHYALKDINGKLARLVDKDTGEISSPAGKALRDIRDKITGELRKIPEYARGSDIEGTLDDTIAGAVKGRKAFTDERSRADVHAEIADMSPSAREAYVTAAGEALRNKISRSGDGTNAARLAYGNEAIREKIGEANAASGAPNAADLTRFDRRMADEKTMFATRSRAMLGTQTAERLADDASTARSVVEGLHAAHDLARGNVISLITRIVRRVAEVNPQMRGRVLDEARKIVLNPDPKAVQGFVDLMKNAGVPEPGQQRIARSLHALTIQKSPADLSSQDDNKKPASWQLVRDKSKGGALVLFNPRTKETRPFKAAGAQ